MPTATNMINEVRVDIGDVDDIDPALEDDVIISKLNKWIYVWHQRIERRLTEVTPADAGMGPVPINTARILLAGTDWFEIMQAYLTDDAGTVYGQPLEIVTAARIAHLQATSGGNDVPKKIAFTRAATSVVSDIGKWTAHLFPTTNDDTHHIGLLVRRFPDLLVDPGDTPDLTELGTLTVCKLAAAECAAIIGEPERAGPILQSVPEETQAQMGIPRAGYKTTTREMATV